VVTRSRQRWVKSLLASVAMAAVSLMGTGAAVPSPAAADASTYSLAASEAPVPENSNSQQSVNLRSDPVCPAVGSCVAVGSYEDSNGDNRGVIETLADGTWTDIQAPLPMNADQGGVSLDAVVCPSVSSCVAVGSYLDEDANADGGDYYDGLIETLSGGTWTATEAPLPATETSEEPGADLVALTCTAEGSCVAVGNYEAGQGRGLIETLSDGTWIPTEAVAPPDVTEGYSTLAAVACASPASCVAVGTYTSISSQGGQVGEGLLNTLSGGTWTALRAPLPSNASTSAVWLSNLSLVSCPTVNFCEAYGTYIDKTRNSDSVFETLTGSTWSPTEITTPSNGMSHTAYADALVCPAAELCVAAGQYEDKKERAQALIEALAGGQWTATEAPLPADAARGRTPGGLLAAIACTSTVNCTAAGYYFDPFGQTHPLIETLTNGTWSDAEPPQPLNESTNDGPSGGLFGVGCEPGDLCVSVGFYTMSANNYPGLLETPSDAITTLAIISADQATFARRQEVSFTVSATGTPVPTITVEGGLPRGLQFREGQGVATIVGVPKRGTAGVYPITITASNGVQPDATQPFTLTITRLHR
jgi:hypothetical protein